MDHTNDSSELKIKFQNPSASNYSIANHSKLENHKKKGLLVMFLNK